MTTSPRICHSFTAVTVFFPDTCLEMRNKSKKTLKTHLIQKGLRASSQSRKLSYSLQVRWRVTWLWSLWPGVAAPASERLQEIDEWSFMLSLCMMWHLLGISLQGYVNRWQSLHYKFGLLIDEWMNLGLVEKNKNKLQFLKPKAALFALQPSAR